MSCNLADHEHDDRPRAVVVREEDRSRLNQLSCRQREVLQRIAEGRNTKEIAAALEITVKTVEAHRLRLMRRLQINHVAGLVRFAIRAGLVSLED
jgi:DNA-binding NarL/FixJ family response regulator